MYHSCFSPGCFSLLYFLNFSIPLYSFKFTKLDHNDPDKPFTFALCLDPDTDKYKLTECNPRLNQKQIDDVIDVLNADKNGLNGFVVRMRKLFKETL
jgi:hypothetical protein